MFSEEVVIFDSGDNLSKLFNPSNDEWVTINETKEIILNSDVIKGSFIRSIRVILDRTPSESEVSVTLTGIKEDASEKSLIDLNKSSDFNNEILINSLESDFTKLKLTIKSKNDIKFKNILLCLLTKDYNKMGYMIDEQLIIKKDNTLIEGIEFSKENLERYGVSDNRIDLSECENKGLIFKKEKEDEDNIYYICKVNAEDINKFIKIQGSVLSDRTDCSVVIINTSEKNSIIKKSIENDKNIFPVMLNKNDLIKNIKVYYSKKGDE